MTTEQTGQRRGGRPVIYTIATLPEHYVARSDDGQLYLFAGQPDGWRYRRAYHGHTAGLARLDTETARLVQRLANGEFNAWRILEDGWIVED